MIEFKQDGLLPHHAQEYRKHATAMLALMQEDFVCESREGVLEGKAGDFVAADGHGGFYPISAEFHAENYEEVTGMVDDISDKGGRGSAKSDALNIIQEHLLSAMSNLRDIPSQAGDLASLVHAYSTMARLEHPQPAPVPGPVKTLHNSTVSGARKNVKDIKVVGNGDLFQLLCKASSEAEGWMKSTKAMEVRGIGCVVQVTTQQRNIDGTYSVAEALTFVPGAYVLGDFNEDGSSNGGRKLVDG